MMGRALWHPTPSHLKVIYIFEKIFLKNEKKKPRLRAHRRSHAVAVSSQAPAGTAEANQLFVCRKRREPPPSSHIHFVP
jgi:hypothetical protein